MLTYAIRTFGCQMNISDTERIAAVMAANHYRPASERLADILIVNTCSVRQSAEDRAVGQIRIGQQRKQRVVITGCLARQESFVKKFSSGVFFCDIADLAALPSRLTGHRPKTIDHRPYFKIRPTYSSPAEAFVPIMTGCDNYCSYCIVPYVRGRERSRPVKEIMEEIKKLIAAGYKQITLLGQNVNSYHCGSTIFPNLLERIARLPGNFRVFFITSHPKDFSLKIIRLVKKYTKLCPYFHLPVQAGSDRILKQMNRRYTRSKYLKLLTQIRHSLPRAAITTDIIVGFPGETKKDFQQSVSLFKKARFDLAYIARYSPRPGTASASIPDDVSLKEKAWRAHQLEKIMKATALARNRQAIGQTTSVLVEISRPQGRIYWNFGKNEYFKTVKFPSREKKQYQLVPVTITRATSWGLYGRPTQTKNHRDLRPDQQRQISTGA